MSSFVGNVSGGGGLDDNEEFSEPRKAMAALELLEEHYQSLIGPDNDDLRSAIDRLTSVFKRRLFKALLDIRIYCETILQDPGCDRSSKTARAHELADKWERLCPMQATAHSTVPVSSMKSAECLVRNQNTDLYSGLEECEFIGDDPSTVSAKDYADHWMIEDVILNREAMQRSISSSSTLSSSGLGFSIAGGVDAPCIPTDNSIFITRITPQGLAHHDGRLRMHDIILRVNNVSFINITHSNAVETLKRSGGAVSLQVKRLAPPNVEQITLSKDACRQVMAFEHIHRHYHHVESLSMEMMGFWIHGGINSEVFPGDHGVFVQKIKKKSSVDMDGRLKLGDRLLMVQTDKNDYDLTFVDFNQAVEFVNQALNEISDTVTLVVGHITNAKRIAHDDTSGGGKFISSVSHGVRAAPVPPGGVRRIQLERSRGGGFGFNIVGGDGGEGIFVSLVLPGGAADLNGKLRRGDQILSVNNIDLRFATHEDAALTLRNAGPSALITVKYCPNQLYSFDDRTSVCDEDDFIRSNDQWQRHNGSLTGGLMGHHKAPAPSSHHSTLVGTNRRRRQFYIRTHFDYDAFKDSGLPGRGLNFRRGNILHVTNAADDDWWQARHVDALTGVEDDHVGIIPSRKRVERKERASLKKVNFSKSTGGKKVWKGKCLLRWDELD
ncbi:hypothetical protein ACOME3_009060 [Neoechinorhynchus agilis]